MGSDVMSSDVDAAASAIDACASIALACHVSPDGDALGSMLALHHLCLAAERSTFDLPIASMSRQLFELHRFAYLQLVGVALERAELDRELRLVVTWVTQADLDRFGVGFDETEGLIDLVRRTDEADVACA